MKKLLTRSISTLLSLILLVGLIPPIKQTVSARISEDGSTELYGNKYTLYLSDFSYEEARIKCNELGGHLVTITSREENDRVCELIKNENCAYWIGLCRDYGDWRWLTGETASFLPWGDGEPFRDDCLCARICADTDITDSDGDNYVFSKGEWDGVINTTGGKKGHSVPCAGFICEWENKVNNISPGHKTEVETEGEPIEYNGHKYKTFFSNASYEEACMKCEKLGGHLVTITSKEENDKVSEIVTGSDRAYWIGLCKDYGDWYWLTFENFSFENWGEGEPFRSDCVAARICAETDFTTYNGEHYSYKKGEWDGVIHTTGGRKGHSVRCAGFICEWDDENDYSSMNENFDNIIRIPVKAETSGGGNEPLGGIDVNILYGSQIIMTKKTDSDGIVEFPIKELVDKGYSVDNLIWNATVSAAKKYETSYGTIVLTPEHGQPTRSLADFAGTSDDYLLLNKITYCLDFSVAYNSQSVKKQDVINILEETRKAFYKLTGGRVALSFNTVTDYSNDKKVEHSGADIFVISECEEGAYAQMFTDSRVAYKHPSKHVYCDKKHFKDNVMCHELLHYLFAAKDEYCCGYKIINNDYNLRFLESDEDYSVYWVDNSENIIDGSEKFTSSFPHYSEIFPYYSLYLNKEYHKNINNGDLYYIKLKDYIDDVNRYCLGNFVEKDGAQWENFFPTPGIGDIPFSAAGYPHSGTDFGVMEDNNLEIGMSTSGTYDYLLQDFYGASKSVNTQHPGWYTAQYYEHGCSVEDTVKKCLKDEAEDADIEYSLSYDGSNVIESEIECCDYLWNPDSFSADGSEEIVISENQNSANNADLLNGAIRSDSEVCFASFAESGSGVNINLKSDEINNAVILVETISSDNPIRYDVHFTEGNAAVSISESVNDIDYIYILTEKDGEYYYNQYTTEYFDGMNSDYVYNSSLLTVSSPEDIGQSYMIFSGDCKYESGEYYSFIKSFDLVKTDDSENQNTEMIQSVPVSSGIDFNSIKVYKYDGTEYSEVESYLCNEGTYISVHINCSGEGKYIVMAKPAGNSAYSAPTNLKINSAGSYEKEVQVTFSDQNNADNIVAYRLYYSTDASFNKNSPNVLTKTLEKGNGEYTLYLSDDYGKYYYAIEAVGVDGAASPLSDKFGFDLKEKDSDNDGIPDWWVALYPVLNDLDNIADTDIDNDGLKNIEEYVNGTNPLNPDTDGDNVYDGMELLNGLDPLQPKTDGENDDYIIVYGSPEIGFDTDAMTIDQSTGIVTLPIKNSSWGKGMRTNIYYYDAENNIQKISEVNFDSFASVNYELDVSLLENGMRIVIDEEHKIFDSDYSNNEFVYYEPENISFETDKYFMVKNSTERFVPTLEPVNAAPIYSWSISSDNEITIDEAGIITAAETGTALVTVTTVNGLTASFSLKSVDSSGAEESTLTIDDEARLISGFVNGIEDLYTGFDAAEGSTISFDKNAEKVYTGMPINVLDKNGNVISEYAAVIIGDTDGDGCSDGMDAVIVSAIADGMLSEQDVGKASYRAADCNEDGRITESDVDLLTLAGIYEYKIRQVSDEKSQKADILFANEFDFDSFGLSYTCNGGQVEDINHDNNSVILKAESADCYMEPWYGADNSMNLIPGHTYRVRYTAENLGDENTTADIIFFARSSEASTDLDNMKDMLLAVDAGQTQIFDSLYTVPAGCPLVKIRFGVRGGSTVRFSDVAVQNITNPYNIEETFSLPDDNSVLTVNKGTAYSDYSNTLLQAYSNGYYISGWYTEKDSNGNGTGEQFNCNTVISSNTKLYPRWQKLLSADKAFEKEYYCSSENDFVSYLATAQKSKNPLYSNSIMERLTKELLTDQGYTPVDKNMNDGSGGSFIYAGYQMSENIKDAARCIMAYSGSSDNAEPVKYQNINGYDCAFYLVGKFPASDIDGAVSGVVNLNKGVGGNYIYLYVSKDPHAGTPITGFTWSASSTMDGWIPVCGTSDSSDDVNSAANMNCLADGENILLFYNSNAEEIESDELRHCYSLAKDYLDNSGIYTDESIAELIKACADSNRCLDDLNCCGASTYSQDEIDGFAIAIQLAINSLELKAD